MADNALILNATDQAGNKLQRSITCTAEDAARDKLLTFAQGINGLLTNNFVEAKRIQKVNLDDDPDGGWHSGNDIGYDVIPYPEAASEPDASKTTPTLTLGTTSMQSTALDTALTDAGHYDVAVAYNGDGTLYLDYIAAGLLGGSIYAARIVNDNGYKLRFYGDPFIAESGGFAATYTIRSTTTDTCNQASATFTITD